MRTTAARSALAAIGFLAVAAIACRELLAGRLLFELDVHLTFVPLREGLGEAWRSSWPIWESRIGNGMSMPANPLQAAWYPPNVLFAFGDAATIVTWLTVAHAVFGAFGTWRLSRRLGTAEPGAWLAAVVFAFNGVALSAMAYANLAWSAAWVPWLLGGWIELVRGTRVRGAFAEVSVSFAMLLAIAEPFALLAVAPALVGLSVDRWWSESQGRVPVPAERARATRLLWLPVAAVMSGTALALPGLLAILRYVPHSVRAVGFDPAATMYWSAHPALAVGMLLPGAFGDARLDGLSRFWAGTLAPEKGFPLFVDPYLGCVTLALAVVAVSFAPRAWRVWFLWGALLALLALGRHGPLYPWLAGLWPLSSLRFPMKWLVPAMVPLALLAGAGVDALGREETAWRRLAWTTVVALVLCAVAAQLALPALSPVLDRLIVPADSGLSIDESVREIARGSLLDGTRRGALGLAAVLGLSCLAIRRPGGGRRFALAAIVVLAACDLGLRAPRVAPTAPRSLYTERSPLVDAVFEDARRRSTSDASGRTWVEAPPYVTLRFAPAPTTALQRARLQRAGLFGYTGASQGLDLAFNPDVGQTRPIRYARMGSMVRQAPAREKAMLLGAAGVTHMASYAPLDDPDLESLGSFELGTTRALNLYRNGLALRRIRLVAGARPYDDDAAFMAAVIDGSRSLFAESTLIESDELRRVGLHETPPFALPGSGGAREVTIIDDRPGRLVAETGGDGGWLVVADTWVPGWRAEIDGRAAPLVRADYAFRAVPVPAGSHVVKLRYRPW